MKTKNTMKKMIYGLVSAILFTACSSAPVNDEDAKRKELQQYKQDLYTLKQKIETLENELAVSSEEEVINVNVSELVSQRFEHFIEVTGNAEADQDVDISPETSGVIERILVKEGDRVSKGQVLAKLKIDALEQTLDEMEIQYDLAKTNFLRQKNLWDQNIGSEMQFLQAKTNMETLEKRIAGIRAQLDMAEIKSPINGIIDIIYQKNGQIGSPQLPFAKVVNVDNIKVYADVSEVYLTKIKQGDEVKVSFPAIGSEMTATINQIGNVVDPNNRTFRIRINLNNRDRMIKPNLVSVIKIRDYLAEEAIVIPALYIKNDFKGEYTYVAENENGKTMARKKYVTSGMTDNNITEIRSGLVPGMKIISEGFNQVTDGTLVWY